jgi:Na+/H+ antiporter NhaD/arsenite permease-like protein
MGPVPVEFLLFAVVLAGVVLFPARNLPIAITGALVLAAYKVVASPFAAGAGARGLIGHLQGEWVTLCDLGLLLLGFSLLATHFERSRLPDALTTILPGDWKGGFALLAAVFVLSSFLDNIAAALIGGALARAVFRGAIHVGYLAAIVAAANAGGSGSVVGDTTTTMLWISGVGAGEVVAAYVAAGTALVLCGVIAARQQQRLSPIVPAPARGVRVDWVRTGIVVLILAAAIVTNVVINTRLQNVSGRFPFLGVAVWGALALAVPLRAPDWRVLPAAAAGTAFLLSLVLSASMLPVDALPRPGWQAAFGLGVVSAVLNNIPLTELAIRQGGFDWAYVAYAVGFGGSMIWFGSSAGVALTGMFPQARSVGRWLRDGWHVALAYVIGFFVMLSVFDFHPGTPVRGGASRSAPMERAASAAAPAKEVLR